jgi:hypothetical protein
MILPNTNPPPRLTSEIEIQAIAENYLLKAEAVGKFPTPINNLIAAAGIEEVQDTELIKTQFLMSLPSNLKELFESTWQKIRGIADLREKAVYVPASASPPRILFAKAHELGHQVLPWQNLDSVYRDDDVSLSPDALDLFDAEANYFAAEVIFQGRRFQRLARDYKPSFEAVFLLADHHGASRHATLRRYVEEHDEIIAAIPYWPSRYVFDSEGFPSLRKGTMVCSSRFAEKYLDIQVPDIIRTGDPWISARETGDVCEDFIEIWCGNRLVRFHWQSWWNTYSLLVLIRRMPALGVVGRVIGQNL